jgi:hypothetical protein
MNAIANITVKSADYFAGRVDNGSIRLGMVDLCAFDVPAHHRMFATFEALLSSDNFEVDAENAFDACYANPAMSGNALIRKLAK